MLVNICTASNGALVPCYLYSNESVVVAAHTAQLAVCFASIAVINLIHFVSSVINVTADTHLGAVTWYWRGFHEYEWAARWRSG